jgi:putative copper resistance protein D
MRQTLFVAAVWAVLWCVAPGNAFSFFQGTGDMHKGHAMTAPVARQDPAKLEADKKFSEFNHRFAGIFVLLAGLLAFLEPRLTERARWIRYLWSFLFFLPGIYLLFFSDPESWPLGNQTLHYVITQNMQVLQHKLFSLLLLGLGAVEFFRVRKNLKSPWVAGVFPALAGMGALLLLYHSPQAHAAGMDESAHQAMQAIEHQHIGFAVVGFGIALSKAFSDVGRFHPRLMRYLFAGLMVVLGFLLITYTE